MRQAEILIHFIQLSAATMTPEEYDRLVARPLWDSIWENAGGLFEQFDKAANDPELTPDERAAMKAQARRLQAMVEHQSGLRDLPSIDDGE